MVQTRKLYLDICDYERKVVYPLYSNDVKLFGEAQDIVVSTERNGWRELSFTLPTLCETEDGLTDNLALSYIKADYLIRLIDDYETDWFILSEPKVSHSGYAKRIQVTAGHISQLLKVKNLGLEFSDKQGNNVGTAQELLTTILAGTGWSVGHVHSFTEKRDHTKLKRRSLNAPTKTGAFKLICTMCELFEAKPVFHGDSKVVDIVPINPFADYARGSLPDLSSADGVIELHYGTNIRNVTRAMNSENIVTKLYAYGSFGDKTNGYCAIDQCVHTEYEFTVTQRLLNGNVYDFTVQDDAGVDISYHFTASSPILEGDRLIFSLLDPASMLYVWSTKNRVAYPVIKGLSGEEALSDRATVARKTDVKNWFSFIMSFDYYREIGLLSDDMIRMIAEYQRYAPELMQAVNDAATHMGEQQTELSNLIGTVDFCRLDVDTVGLSGKYITLHLNKQTYPDGVMYRSDYDKDKEQRFNWRACDTVDKYGDPINSATSVVYVISDKDPVSGNAKPIRWHKAYLKEMDDDKEPSVLTLWLEEDAEIHPSVDRFYLFAYNAVNGFFGSLEVAEESLMQSLRNNTTVVTQEHQVLFTDRDVSLVSADNVVDYGWLWRYQREPDGSGQITPSSLYFCYKKEGDTRWRRVYFERDAQAVANAQTGEYWFDWPKSVLYRKGPNSWVALQADANNNPIAEAANLAASVSDAKIAAQFAFVYASCLTRDKYWKGVRQRLIYTVPSGKTLPVGSYCFDSGYKSYYAFTTTAELRAGDTLTYHYVSENIGLNGYVVQRAGGAETTLKIKNYRFDNVRYHRSNVIEGLPVATGYIGTHNGVLSTTAEEYVYLEGFGYVEPNTDYVVDGLGTEVSIHYYTDQKTWISSYALPSGNNHFTTPANAQYVRFVKHCDMETFTHQDYGRSMSIHAADMESLIVIDHVNYAVLQNIHGEGRNIGLIDLMEEISLTTDALYLQAYNQVKEAQGALRSYEERMTSLIGDIYREGWWQDANYIAGDEEKLYDDALDNLEKISFPETSYTIDFLDLREANLDDLDFAASEDTLRVQWPDISISSAAHLVDNEIGINTWGFIDKIQKCYDKPYNTKIQINTNLTTIAQHSFADVMSSIADVASSFKGKVSKYDTTMSSSVRYANYDDLLANLVTLTKVTERAGGRVSEMENSITGHASRITQTANLLATEVSRAIASETELASRIQQTADGITLSVKETIASEINKSIGFEVSIHSDRGNFITPQIRTLTLVPVVRSGANDVTPSVTDQYFSWKRNTGNAQQDADWNRLRGDTRNLEVTASDLNDKAEFTLCAEIQGERYYATISVANIITVQRLELHLASNLPDVQTRSAGEPSIYSPDWSVTPLCIAPTAYMNGIDVTSSSELTLSWQRREGNGAAMDVSPERYESVYHGALTVNRNLFDLIESSEVSYICTASYEGTSATQTKHYSLIQQSVIVPTVAGCKISGQNVIKYSSTGEALEANIELLAIVTGCSVVEWQYRNGAKQWIKIDGSETSQTLVVHEDDEIFTNDYAVIRVITTTGAEDGPSDTTTIYKVYDGSQISTVFFSKDSIGFEASLDGNIEPGSSQTVNIVAYLGKDKVLPASNLEILNRDALPNGMEVALGNPVNMELPVTITVGSDENAHNLGGIDAQSGYIDIVITSPTVTTLRLQWIKTIGHRTGSSVSDFVTYYAKWPIDDDPPGYPRCAMFTNETPVLGLMLLSAAPHWSATPPKIDPYFKYLWAYDVITYSDETSRKTDPRIIGVYGNDGAIGLTYGMYTPKGEVFNQDTQSLETVVYMFAGVDDLLPSCTFSWEYYYDGEWRETGITEPSHTWDAQWLKAHCSGGATMRCVITYGKQAYYTYCNLIDRTDNYQAMIYASGGDVLYNGSGSTTLLCRIYQNGKEVDADGLLFQYRWTRLDQNGQVMDADGVSFAEGKSLVIRAGENITETTTYVCYAYLDEGGYSTQAQFTVDYGLGIVYSDTEPENPILNMLWMNTDPEANATNVLCRWNGEAFVEVTVPQKTLEEMQKNILTHSTSIQELSDRITLSVEESERRVMDSFGNFIQNDFNTFFEQTSKDITATVQSQIENKNSITGINDFNRKITTWLKFDENGMEMGKNDTGDEETSRFRSRLTNEKLAFIEDNEEVSYFSNKAMYITEARVTNTFNVGSNRADMAGWFQYAMGLDGLSITWKAEDFVTYKFKAKVNYTNANASQPIPAINTSAGVQDRTYTNYFAFMIQETDADRNPITNARRRYSEIVQNAANGEVFFNTLTFDTEGDRYFTIRQVEGGQYGDDTDPGTREGKVTYDTKRYYAKLRVVRSANYSKFAISDLSVYYLNGSSKVYLSDPKTQIIFNNVYSAQ